MTDRIKVNTELLTRCAGELKTTAQGFEAAAALLAGLNTGEEWWTKAGRFTAIRLQDEGSSTQLADAGATVRSLTAAMRRYNGRLTKLGDTTARAAAMFNETENRLYSRARGQNAGTDGNIIGAAGVVSVTSVCGETGKPRAPKAANGDADKQKREEQAKWLKIGVGALAFVGSVAVVIGTGGAALPVIAAGVAAGAVTAGVNNAADQYAEKGWDDINWGDAGKDAVIGGVVGGVTSSISIGGSYAASQVLNHVAPAATSTARHVVAHTIGGAASSMATGAASRAGGEAVSEYLHDGSVNWNQVRDRAFDPSQMAADGVLGGATGYMRGRRYVDSSGQYVRDRSYLNADGDVDWSRAPNSGIDTTKPVTNDYVIQPGTQLRRSGSEYGGYLRNVNDSYKSASLPYEYNPFTEHRYEVIKPIPGVTQSTAAPAFDMPGGATQYQLPNDVNIKDLIDKGFLRKIY